MDSVGITSTNIQRTMNGAGAKGRVGEGRIRRNRNSACATNWLEDNHVATHRLSSTRATENRLLTEDVARPDSRQDAVTTQRELTNLPQDWDSSNGGPVTRVNLQARARTVEAVLPARNRA